MTYNDHCPLPYAGSFNCLNWLGGGTEREVRGRTARGEGAGWEGKGKGALRPVGALVFRERMRKAPAVQSGRALPMGRCGSRSPAVEYRIWEVSKLPLGPLTMQTVIMNYNLRYLFSADACTFILTHNRADTGFRKGGIRITVK